MKKDGKQKKIIYNIVILISLLALVTGAVCILLLALKRTKREPVYQYVSLSEGAAARAYIWLDQIEDMPLSYEEILEMMGEINLTIVLTPTQEKGIYERSLEEGSFADCGERAKRGLETAYREVVKYRLSAAGYEGGITDALPDQMMRETYGVSVSEYLSFCDVQLLPPLEELEEMYSGEVAYEYE